MELTPELLGTGFVGLIVILGALGNYLRTLKAPPPPGQFNPVLAGFGIGLIEREQADKLLALQERQAAAQERMAAALGLIADKDRSELRDMVEDLLRDRRRS